MGWAHTSGAHANGAAPSGKGWWRRATCLLLVALAGCSDAGNSDDQPIAAPQTISIDGVDWTQAETISQKDNQVLNVYFRANPAMTDNPNLEGELTLFTNPKGDRRFYWLATTQGQTTWFCVEQAGRRLRDFDGVGDPFQTP